MITTACASGGSSVRLTSMCARVPGGVIAASRSGGAAGERQRRLAAGQVDDADVAPEHAGAKPGAQRLGQRLLGGVAPRVGVGAVRPPLGLLRARAA